MGLSASKKSRTRDPYRIEERLERQIDVHLKEMETHPELIDFKSRLSTIQYVGMYLNRKYGWGDEEEGDVGSAVRKYAGAFKTAPHVTGGGKDRARPDRVTGGINRTFTDDSDEDAA